MFYRFTPLTSAKEYYFQDPDTKHKYRANNMQELCSQIRLYRAQNELPVLDYLETVVESYLCRRPENIGGCEPIAKLKRGVFPTIRGGIALLASVLYNSFVPQVVADERAKICTDCKLNVFPDKTGFIKWADALAAASVGDRRSKYHDKLGNCDGCSCLLRAKVFYNGPMNLKNEEKEKMQGANSQCWQLR